MRRNKIPTFLYGQSASAIIEFNCEKTKKKKYTVTTKTDNKEDACRSRTTHRSIHTYKSNPRNGKSSENLHPSPYFGIASFLRPGRLVEILRKLRSLFPFCRTMENRMKFIHFRDIPLSIGPSAFPHSRKSGKSGRELCEMRNSRGNALHYFARLPRHFQPRFEFISP